VKWIISWKKETILMLLREKKEKKKGFVKVCNPYHIRKPIKNQVLACAGSLLGRYQKMIEERKI